MPIFIIVLIFVTVLCIGLYVFVNSGIQLPKNIDQLIQEVQREPLPTGHALHLDGGAKAG